MNERCRLHPDRPAIALLCTDDHQVLTRRKTGLDEIPVCAACLRRWRRARALKRRPVPVQEAT